MQIFKWVVRCSECCDDFPRALCNFFEFAVLLTNTDLLENKSQLWKFMIIDDQSCFYSQRACFECNVCISCVSKQVSNLKLMMQQTWLVQMPVLTLNLFATCNPIEHIKSKLWYRTATRATLNLLNRMRSLALFSRN